MGVAPHRLDLATRAELSRKALHDEHAAHRQDGQGEHVHRPRGRGRDRALSQRGGHEGVGEADDSLRRAGDDDGPGECQKLFKRN